VKEIFLIEKSYFTGVKRVNCTNNLDFSLFLHAGEKIAALANIGHCLVDVGFNDLVDEFLVLGAMLSVITFD